jgi:hypothetical protein
MIKRLDICKSRERLVQSFSIFYICSSKSGALCISLSLSLSLCVSVYFNLTSFFFSLSNFPSSLFGNF